MLTELVFFFSTSHSSSQEQPLPSYTKLWVGACLPRSACPSSGLFSAKGLSQGSPAHHGDPDLQLSTKEQSAHAMASPTPSSLPSHVPVLPDSPSWKSSQGCLSEDKPANASRG